MGMRDRYPQAVGLDLLCHVESDGSMDLPYQDLVTPLTCLAGMARHRLERIRCPPR